MNKEIFELKQNGEFRKGAILLLRQKPGQNSWDDAALAYFLRKSGRLKAALEVCRNAFPFSKENDWFRREYALAIYWTVDWLNGDAQEQVHALKALASLDAQDWMLAKAGYHTAKVLYAGGDYHDGQQIILGLRDTEMEPEMAEWVRLLKLKFMAALENFPGILAETEADCEKRPPKPFVLRLRAKALQKTGDTAAALSLYLNRILPAKDDWYLFAEAASLLEETGDSKRAATFLALALLKSGQDKMKIKAMDTLGRILHELDFEGADYFTETAAAIRLKEGWKLPANSPVPGEAKTRRPRLDKKKAEEVFLRFAPLEPATVTKVGGGGQFCFIRAGKESLFCSKKNAVGIRAIPKQGEKTRFMKMKGFDYKKNCFSPKGILAPFFKGES